MRQGTWDFSRGSTGELDLPSYCERILGIPFESVQENQAISGVEKELGVLSNCTGNGGVLLEFQGETGLPLICDRNVGIPLKMKQGNGISSRDEEGKPGHFFSCGGKLGLPLEWTGTSGSFQMVARPLECLSSFKVRQASP